MNVTNSINTNAAALQQNVILGDKYRITMLTDGLVRLEYAEDGRFLDQASQVVLRRDFPQTDYRIYRTKDTIEIVTSRLHISYDEKEFSGRGLTIQVTGNISVYHSKWCYGDDIKDLGGTARTLDEADGAVDLDHGVVSRFGFSLLDDSNSLVFQENGWIRERTEGTQDLYFFGYGHDYKKALKDYYYLCGETPMLPRYALGNWWSRYYKYSEQSYLELMDRFEEEKIPFTVAVIDMDWHKVDIDPKYGSGWTGYSWNKDLFPNPGRFMEALHKKGMHVSLNVHPAAGVRAYEDDYPSMANAMHMDPDEGNEIPFDASDPVFMEAYFRCLHHPKEDEGVDFWWIDWQQGTSSKIKGLDPLWVLNHFHFLDNQRRGKRPMIFSRYSGPGSHRYPIGFSGDSIISWKSLDFQPFFTANASNIGYGWWSHDIGGHMAGYKDDELQTRWFQFGTFSPIMRLHSSLSEFNGKEPWRFKKEAEQAMKNTLRERHRLIPYLYTMNYRNYKEGIPLILPLYYEYPKVSYPAESSSYTHENEYFFGSELLVAPITSPRIAGINMAKVNVWLPEGRWYDIFTGMIYKGGREVNMYRSIESIPVLAKAGAILPLTDEISVNDAIKNPDSLHIRVYAGEDGQFSLYEDDNDTCQYQNDDCVVTQMSYVEDETCHFVIEPAKGNLKLIPKKRDYVIGMTGFSEAVSKDIKLTVDEKEMPYKMEYNPDKTEIDILVSQIPVESRLVVSIDRKLIVQNNQAVKRVFDFLNQAEIPFIVKETVYQRIQQRQDPMFIITELSGMELDRDLLGVVSEIIGAM